MMLSQPYLQAAIVNHQNLWGTASTLDVRISHVLRSKLLSCLDCHDREMTVQDVLFDINGKLS